MVKSVLLIGLGNVAVGYDAYDTTSTKVLTHARAFSQHPFFCLVGGVDIDAQRRSRFEANYNVITYSKTEDAMRDLSPDIVVIATPSAMHLQTVIEVFEAGRPSAILCEKPLAYNLVEAQKIVDICATFSCALFVNFFRQAGPGMADIRARLADKRIGYPLNGVVWYSKGLFNSGAHLISLLQNLLGDVSDIKLIRAGRLWHDIDPEPDVDITFANGRVVFLAAREEDFFHNTIELIAPNGRLRFELGGAKIVWQSIEKDLRFKDYIRLSEVCESIFVDFDRIQWYVAEQLAMALQGQIAHLCNGEDALRVQEVLDIIKDKI